jgi:hypothetical protein
MGLCFVYDPMGPRLYTLNTTAWLVLLLCEGATRDDIVAALHHEVEPLLTLREAATQVDETLADLLKMGLVVAAAAPERTTVLPTAEGG